LRGGEEHGIVVPVTRFFVEQIAPPE